MLFSNSSHQAINLFGLCVYFFSVQSVGQVERVGVLDRLRVADGTLVV